MGVETITASEALAHACRLLDKPRGTWPEVLAWLTFACQSLGLSFTFQYHNGLFLRPDDDASDGWSGPYLEPESRGYTVQVGQHYFPQEGSDREKYWPTPNLAIGAGLCLFIGVLEGRAGAAGP